MLNELLSMAHLVLDQKFSTPPIIFDLGGAPVVILYLQWVLLLPVAGAVGAYLSKRAGGSRRLLLLSSVFPALPFVATFVCIIPASPFFDRNIAHHITPAGVLSFTLVRILLCAAALLAGGLPVQLLPSHRATPAARAIS